MSTGAITHRFLLINALEPRSDQRIFPTNVSQGMLAIHAGLRERFPEVDCRLMSWNHLALPDRFEAFRETLRAMKPDAVGISAYSVAMPLTIDIASTVREVAPEIPIVVGGMHPTASPEGLDRYPMFDYYVRGEGVRVCADLLRHLFLGESSLDAIPSLVYRDNGRVVLTTPEVPPKNMDENPQPDWSLLRQNPRAQADMVRLDEFFCLRLRGGTMVPYETSQGCGEACLFCERVNGTRFRAYSPERIVSDIEAIERAIDLNTVWFADEHVHRAPHHFQALLDQLGTIRDLGVEYYFAVRADEIGRDSIDQMIDIGTRYLHVFPETASPRISTLMQKNFNLEEAMENIAYASDRGLYIMGGFLFGWPSETLADIDMTMELARSPLFDFIFMPKLYCLARADMGRYLLEHGIEPDTPAYFEYLDGRRQICLADYPAEEYRRIMTDKTQLNVDKTASARTRRKLEALGAEMLYLPLDVAPNADSQSDPARG